MRNGAETWDLPHARLSTEVSLKYKSTMPHSINTFDTNPMFSSAYKPASFAGLHAQCNSNPYLSFLKFLIFSSVNLVNPFVFVLLFCKFNFPKPGVIANNGRNKHNMSTFLIIILQFIRLRCDVTNYCPCLTL